MKAIKIVFITVITLFLTVNYAFSRAEYDVDNFDTSKENNSYQVLSTSDTIIDPPINWPIWTGVQQTGKIITQFNCAGIFGEGFNNFPEVPYWPEGSFRVDGSQYLFAGAIWIGGIVGDDTLVSTGADGWVGIKEMYPTNDEPTVTRLNFQSDYSMRAEYSDTSHQISSFDYFSNRPHLPLNVEVTLRSHIWRTEPENNVVIYDMIITNYGWQTIEDAVVGFYYDCDVCPGEGCGDNQGFRDDITGYLGLEEIAYIIDNDGDPLDPPTTPRAFGFKILETSFYPTVSNFNWWISHGSPQLDFGPRQQDKPGAPFRDFGTGGLGTPEGDANKYYIMTFPEFDYDQIYTGSISPDDTLWLYPQQGLAQDYTDGYDTRFLISLGTFNLAPFESERFLFANLTSEAIHTDSLNIYNLPENPELFYDNLDFTSLIDYGAIADSLAQTLLDPNLPPIGLKIWQQDNSQVTVRWDPWCFSGIMGYKLYSSQIPYDSFPYPGVVPPWLEPEELVEVASLSTGTNYYTFDIIDPDYFYFVNVAHETPAKTGEVSDPIFIKQGSRSSAPEFAMEYVFIHEGEQVELNWSPPVDMEVDHYNIYRFDSLTNANRKYHAFYDDGYHKEYDPYLDPVDSFDIEGTIYYYYQMNIIDQIPGSDTTFVEAGIDEGAVYVVSAVDEFGYESEFSINVSVMQVEERTQDILVVTHSRSHGTINEDSVFAFYNNLLGAYDYDIYDWKDTTSTSHNLENADWHDFSRYKLLILDDGLYERILPEVYERDYAGYTKYLLSGGKIAHFGSFYCIEDYHYTDNPMYRPVTKKFVDRFFGIDSIFYVGFGYFNYNNLPMEDTIFAFQSALPISGSIELSYDTVSNRFSNLINQIWPTDDSPPSVSTFVPDNRGEVTYLYDAIDGVNSMNDGLPVGIRTTLEHSDTYLFGFHLWYMNIEEAQALINSMLTSPPKTIMEPDTLDAIYAHLLDPLIVQVYLGNFSEDDQVADIDMNSVRLLDDIEPEQGYIIPDYPGFNGEVAVFDFRADYILDKYLPFYGINREPFYVEGLFNNATEFNVSGQITLLSYKSGDYNHDGDVNVSDLVFLIDFLFRGGSAPDICDITGDNECNVIDLTYFVDYLFRGGPAPLP